MAKKKTEPESTGKTAREKTPATPKPQPPEKAGSGARSLAFPVIGLGASAGGLEALEEFFRHAPADSGMAFVVVTHQHPGHTSLLPELLGRTTRMPVLPAADGIKVEPNQVHVGPPGEHLTIIKGVLHLMPSAEDEAPRLPIDCFFRSLAEDQKERAIGIILSGTGSDGTLGLKAIKAESGMVMVQEVQSAKYSGMPSAAIATGQVDYVLPPDKMPQQLMAYAEGLSHRRAAKPAAETEFPFEPIKKIFQLLLQHTKHDFSNYKTSTIRRRIERRMNVHQIQDPDLYVRYLQDNAHEIDTLFKELLISVTSFFRDPEAFDALAQTALPELLQARPENSTLRIWVPGCSTGEEAYSLAILLHECMGQLKKSFDVQIFGTDLDSEAIAAARMAVYPDGIAGDVSRARLERYFFRKDHVYRIRKEIREMVIFAPQNVIKDPPFTKLDLLSCRNLLIYLNAGLQNRLLSLFHYSLKPNGILFLGLSETIGNHTDLFAPIDKRWKIFRRKEAESSYVMMEFPAQPATESGAPSQARHQAAESVMKKEAPIATYVENFLLARFAPVNVVVNEQGDIIYVHGRTGMYLELTSGQPRHNILEMARDGLKQELGSALRQAARKVTEIVRESVPVKTNGDVVEVKVSVQKITDHEALQGLLLITFQPAERSLTPAAKKKTRKGRQAPVQAEELERELRHTKESLQITIEELEAANEELQSANEELQSINEELQSTNEELETSKEEMQSLNEELTTVNAELHAKLEELSRANDDMQNLLNNADIATIFLDNQLRIKRFAEKTRELISVIQTDVGRPIADLASNLRYNELVADCREVLRTLIYKEIEVETKQAGWYLMRILPYRTAENVIDGLVITFVDINRLKKAENSLRDARTYFESIFETVREPLLTLDAELRIVSANRSFHKLFQTTSNQVNGKLIYELGGGQWNIPQLRHLLEEILPQNIAMEDFCVDYDSSAIGRRTLLLNARRLDQKAEFTEMILLALEDVTERQSKHPQEETEPAS